GRKPVARAISRNLCAARRLRLSWQFCPTANRAGGLGAIVDSGRPGQSESHRIRFLDEFGGARRRLGNAHNLLCRPVLATGTKKKCGFPSRALTCFFGRRYSRVLQGLKGTISDRE